MVRSMVRTSAEVSGWALKSNVGIEVGADVVRGVGKEVGVGVDRGVGSTGVGADIGRGVGAYVGGVLVRPVANGSTGLVDPSTGQYPAGKSGTGFFFNAGVVPKPPN